MFRKSVISNPLALFHYWIPYLSVETYTIYTGEHRQAKNTIIREVPAPLIPTFKHFHNISSTKNQNASNLNHKTIEFIIFDGI